MWINPTCGFFVPAARAALYILNDCSLAFRRSPPAATPENRLFAANLSCFVKIFIRVWQPAPARL
tara:strand:+ start:22143 stop:22337 length:195 start_codon:yes stop_codon:yes gene_type:complete